MIIAIDFDGTVVTHNYPKVGHDIGAEIVLRKLVDKGHQLILWTMRHNSYVETDDSTGEELTEAIQWFSDNSITLYGVQRNPEQEAWTQSPKCYAQLYIDDAALGCPLIYDESVHPRPYADWVEIERWLVLNGIL